MNLTEKLLSLGNPPMLEKERHVSVISNFIPVEDMNIYDSSKYAGKHTPGTEKSLSR